MSLDTFFKTFKRRLGRGRGRRSAATQLGARVWTLSRLLVLVAALAITYGVFFLTAMRVAILAREVQVPDLRGVSIADADSMLAGLGLTISIDPLRASDPAIPIDSVVSQDPAAGTILRRQRAVRVRISDGQSDPVIPTVAGQAESTAEATLAADAIAVNSTAEIRTTEYPTDTVIAQDPAPDARGSAISLLVNRGERSSAYVMPDLIGTIGDDAIAALRARGFRVTIVGEQPYPGLPPGIVLRQSPQSGFRIAFGEAISLEVSR